jgi:hypothetical protein
MRKNRVPVTALILVAAAGFFLGRAQTRPAAKTPPAKESRSLVRKELLEAKKQDPAPPRRNIFSPRLGLGQPAERVPQAEALPGVDSEATDEQAADEEAPQAPPVINIDLRYIGFIQSAHRLVALVNFEGRAIAVVEGDVVGEGIRIGKVSRQQVEVILPDSSTRTFSLEGE